MDFFDEEIADILKYYRVLIPGPYPGYIFLVHLFNHF
jgi:hypothetical protein